MSPSLALLAEITLGRKLPEPFPSLPARLMVLLITSGLLSRSTKVAWVFPQLCFRVLVTILKSSDQTVERLDTPLGLSRVDWWTARGHYSHYLLGDGLPFTLIWGNSALCWLSGAIAGRLLLVTLATQGCGMGICCLPTFCCLMLTHTHIRLPTADVCTPSFWPNQICFLVTCYYYHLALIMNIIVKKNRGKY